MLQLLSQIDQNILLLIQDSLRNDVLNQIFIFITLLGNSGAVWILISVILLLFKSTRTVGIMSLAALLGSFLINNIILKNLIVRVRPYEVVNGLTRLIAVQKDYSFPSGHAGSSFASAVVLYLELPKKYGVPALILAFLIAFSRLYLGVHYPSDVICGAIIGTAIALLTYKAALYLRKTVI